METKDLEKIIYKWFDMKYQTYNKLDHDGSIYLHYEGERYAEIRIDKNEKDIYYKWKLYDEFSEIIPLEDIEFEEFMVKWVGDTFGLMGFTPPFCGPAGYSQLETPLV